MFRDNYWSAGFKKKYKVALTDFIYTNDYEILFGNLKIALSNTTDEENDKHLKSIILKFEIILE